MTDTVRELTNRLMGLDGVEIVMAVEETFDIRIEDFEAQIIRTPRQLIDLVWAKVAHADTRECLTQRAFHLLRKSLMSRYSVARKLIAPTANLSTLLPTSDHRNFAASLATDVGVEPLPLVRPVWLSRVLGCGAMLIGLAVAQSAHAQSMFMRALIAAGVAGLAALIAQQSTRALRSQLPISLTRVGALSQWIVAHKPDLVTGLQSTNSWTREQVALHIREIVVEHLGCDAHYQEDARFVEDLGMG